MTRILIIEDEQEVAALMMRLLERNGYAIECAHDGEQGLVKMETSRPDLILLDIVMPKMNGYEFYKNMREQKDWKDTPVVVITARAAMRDTFEQLNITKFLVKPVDPQDLLVCVNRTLEDSQARQPIKRAIIAGTEPFKLEYMKEQLSQKGYRVEVEIDGVLALKKAIALMPELFVIQFDMPGLDIDEVNSLFASHPGTQNISVVVYSHVHSDQEVKNSPWYRLMNEKQDSPMRPREKPIKVIEKLDSKKFIDKVQDYL